MKLEETGIIMDILTAAYPRFYNGLAAKERQHTLQLWGEMFADWDVAIVAAAVKTYIATDIKGFPPHIGAIMNSIHSMANTGGLDAAEAWELVRTAVSNSGYGAKKEFERLPENIQRIVGSASQLYEWSQMDSDVFNSVVASNFQKAYMRRQESDRKMTLMPCEIKKVISGMAGQMALEDGSKRRDMMRLSEEVFG